MDLAQPIQLSINLSPLAIFVGLGTIIGGALAFIVWAVGTLIMLWKESQKVFEKHKEDNQKEHAAILAKIGENSKEIAYLKGQKGK